MSKLEFLKGRTLIVQNDVSFLLNDNKQIQIHYLINDKPGTIQCSISQIIQSFLNNSENDSEKATRISFPKSDSETD